MRVEKTKAAEMMASAVVVAGESEEEGEIVEGVVKTEMPLTDMKSEGTYQRRYARCDHIIARRNYFTAVVLLCLKKVRSRASALWLRELPKIATSIILCF